MQSDARTVDLYLEGVPEARKAALNRLREMCLSILIDHSEEMQYGMACYCRNGVPEVAFASQKNYISLYIPVEVLDNYREDLKGSASLGKVCIRYSRPEKIDFTLVEKMLEASFLSEKAL